MDKRIEETMVPVLGYEGIYELSSSGSVWLLLERWRNGHTKPVRREMKLNKTGSGYLGLILIKNGIGWRTTVHRLVATHFIPNPMNLPTVNHKDGDKTNNDVSNLEWSSMGDNIRHSFKNGLNKAAEKNRSKLSKPVLQFSISGSLLQEFPSLKEVERQLGFKHPCILHGIKYKKIRYGYYWEYKKTG